MGAREVTATAIRTLSTARSRRLVRLTVFVLACGAISNGQSSLPDGSSRIPAQTSIYASLSSDRYTSTHKTQGDTSQVSSTLGNITGTVLGETGSVAVGATVRLTLEHKWFSRGVMSGINGQSSFSSVPPDHIKLSVSSAGLSKQEFSAELASVVESEAYIVGSNAGVQEPSTGDTFPISDTSTVDEKNSENTDADHASGHINGTIIDQTGAVAVGAHVRLTRPDEPTQEQARSGLPCSSRTAGRFAQAEPPGIYRGFHVTFPCPRCGRTHSYVLKDIEAELLPTSLHPSKWKPILPHPVMPEQMN